MRKLPSRRVGLPDHGGGRMRLDGCRAAAVSRGSAGRPRHPWRRTRRRRLQPGPTGPRRQSRHRRPWPSRRPGRRRWTRRDRWRWPRRWTCVAFGTGAAAATPRGSTAAGWCSTCSRGRASRCHGTCGGNSRSATKSPPANCGPGDLLFFNTESDGASHVAIALDGQTFVHAPNSRGVVRVERLSTAYWSQRLLGARRIE